jgi:pyridoxamine 5'-phosphate oxidase
MMTDSPWRDTLRALPVFSGELPTFDTDAAPDSPIALLEEWLTLAIEADVSQPHSMTLATVRPDGTPAARTLLLKDVTDDGLWFASLETSPKGRDLAANPHAALTLYWREQGRQIRVTGSIEKGPREVSEKDFLARKTAARAAAIAGPESEVLSSQQKFLERVEEAKAILDFRPTYVPDEWNAYLVKPESIEFWQAARDRDQVRLRYLRDGSGWQRDLLWP